jgi:hypothetical protein
MLKAQVKCNVCLNDLEAEIDKLSTDDYPSVFIKPCVRCLIAEENRAEEEAERRVAQLEAAIVKYRWYAADYEQRRVWLKRGLKMPPGCGAIESPFDDPNVVEG